MNQSTINKLNEINRDFYAKIATEFSLTRAHAWEGWELLLPSFKQAFASKKEITILDIGCGNGRFGKFFCNFAAQQSGPKVTYIGIDSNQELLDAARQIMSQEVENKNLHIIKGDLLDLKSIKLPSEKVDLICLFGVIHHIPSLELAKELLAYLASRLSEDGLLVFAAWRFDRIPNIFERRKSSSEFAKYGIKREELTENDYLLTWERGKHSVRYCHLTTDAEMAELISATKLKEITRFQADGPNDNANEYVVLKK